MRNLHVINYNNFSPNEICQYLDDRYYSQVLQDFETVNKYIINLPQSDYTQSLELVITLFYKLETEINQLFVKDRILLFPHVISEQAFSISLVPINIIHQRIMTLLQKIREIMNNYVQKPTWSSAYKIFSNELYSLEQLIHHILFVKENYIWTRVNSTIVNEG